MGKNLLEINTYRTDREDCIRLQELSHAFRLYWLCMKLFYPMYGQAIKAAMEPTTSRFTKIAEA